jgi:hypothetical protein
MSDSAQLFINGKHVGDVKLKSRAESWGFGDFAPNAAFGEFAPLFGNWSLLLHADDDERKMSEAASEELRVAERAIDSLRAKLFHHAEEKWLIITQLNIDGPLIEWKGTESGDASPR